MFKKIRMEKFQQDCKLLFPVFLSQPHQLAKDNIHHYFQEYKQVDLC